VVDRVSPERRGTDASELVALVEEQLASASDAFRSAILELRDHSRSYEEPGVEEAQWRARQTVLAQAHCEGSAAVQRTIDDIFAMLHRVYCGALDAHQWWELTNRRNLLQLAFLRIYLSPVDDDRRPGQDGLQAAWDDADEQHEDFKDRVLQIVASANADTPCPLGVPPVSPPVH
jgi:hypothetical protein